MTLEDRIAALEVRMLAVEQGKIARRMAVQRAYAKLRDAATLIRKELGCNRCGEVNPDLTLWVLREPGETVPRAVSSHSMDRVLAAVSRSYVRCRGCKDKV